MSAAKCLVGAATKPVGAAECNSGGTVRSLADEEFGPSLDENANAESTSAPRLRALRRHKCYRAALVASGEMLPAIAPATMLPPLLRKGYGHQDDPHGAG
jgi:hypothetical protein